MQVRGLACGGGDDYDFLDTLDTCDMWTAGTWTRTRTSHKLREKRFGHVSWDRPSGVFLIGGYYSEETSELVKDDGSVEEGFPLKNKTR